MITLNKHSFSMALAFLETAIGSLQFVLNTLREAVSRCQNCGKVMDQSVCPYCGAVQK